MHKSGTPCLYNSQTGIEALWPESWDKGSGQWPWKSGAGPGSMSKFGGPWVKDLTSKDLTFFIYELGNDDYVTGVFWEGGDTF